MFAIRLSRLGQADEVPDILQPAILIVSDTFLQLNFLFF